MFTSSRYINVCRTAGQWSVEPATPTMSHYLKHVLIFLLCARWSATVTEMPEAEVNGSSVATMASVSVTGSDGEQDTGNATDPGNATDTGNATENTPGPSTQQRSNPYAIINKGTVSKKQYDTSSLVINVILNPAVCVIGVVMNVTGVCVLLQKQFRRSTYIYLTCLALSDICCLLCGIIRTIPKFAIFFDDVIANQIDMYLFPYVSIFLMTTFTRISEYVICALAIERFVAVLLPLKVKELFLCRHAFSVCIGVSVFCTLLHSHYLYIYYPKPYFNPSRNITMYALGSKSWYSDLGIKPVFNIIYEILFLYLPLLVLVTCNIGIIARVWQLKKERRNIVASAGRKETLSKDERRMTLTLLIISLTFLSVFAPLVILTVIQKFHRDIKMFGREHYLLNVMIDVLTLGWNINSANDFIVYIYTSKQFKQNLVDMMRCKRKRASSGRQSSKGTETTGISKSRRSAKVTILKAVLNPC